MDCCTFGDSAFFIKDFMVYDALEIIQYWIHCPLQNIPEDILKLFFFSRFVDKLKYNIWVIKYKRLCYYRWWNIKNICLCKYFHLSCQNSQVIGRWCQNTDSNSQGCRNQAKPYFKGFARVERCECRRMSWWISQKRTAVQINSIGRWNSQRIMKISEIW